MGKDGRVWFFAFLCSMKDDSLLRIISAYVNLGISVWHSWQGISSALVSSTSIACSKVLGILFPQSAFVAVVKVRGWHG